MAQNSRDIPGILEAVDLNDYETQLLLEYIANNRKNDDFDILFGIFGYSKALKLCDMFSGRSIRIPKRKELSRIVEYVKVYAYVRSKGDISLGIPLAAQKFGKKVSSVKRIYEHVDGMLSSDLKDTLYGGGEKQNG